jgi:hypothetical protein
MEAITMTNTAQKFEEVLARLEKAEQIKADHIVTASDLTMSGGRLNIKGLGNAGFTDTGFSQFCNRFGMPTAYAKKCLSEDPRLFTDHMSHWLTKADDKNMLLRTYNVDGHHKIRAVLSDRYGIMDNYAIARSISEDLSTFKAADIQGSGVTSDYFDLRFRFPEFKETVGKLNDGKTDDWVMPGVHVRNSETGLAKLIVSFYIDRLVCSNGMTRSTNASNFTRRHIGRMEIDVNERIHGVMDNWEQPYMEMVEAMRSSKEEKVDVHQFFTNRLADKVSKAQGERIQKAWFEEPGETRHHLVQAITAAARDTKDWGERLEMENFASLMLTAPTL